MAGLQQTRSKGRRASSKLSPPVEEDVSYRERYEDYIGSKRWEKRRVSYYANHPKVCRACQSTDRVHLHHHTYMRMGHELDSDLVPLCERCHDLVHKLHRSSKKTLTAATRVFLQSCDADIDLPGRRPKSRKQKKLARIPRAQRKRRKKDRLCLASPIAVYGGRKDPVNNALAKKREQRREPMVSFAEVIIEFGVTKQQLRHQGYQSKVPLSRVQQWRQCSPPWMRRVS